MARVIVEFTDETETVIATAFTAPQDPVDHPYLGEVEESDPRYIAFMALFPPSNPWG